MKMTASIRRGFSLIELLVVTAIVVLITGVVLANNIQFGGNVLLQNLAYDVALSIRQSQVYGIAVRRFGTSASFGAPYGVHFDTANQTTYALFADANTTNGLFDSGANPSELVQATSIVNGFKIKTLCAISAIGQTETCGLSSIDIIFKRPEPDAYISINGISGTLNPTNLQQQARIQFVSPRGSTMSVVVQANGQIAVQSP